jgi:oxaloacetate decarboxylase alpha subunit
MEFQLGQMQAADRIGEVLEEVVRVRKDLGYPPLGTPFSQMCGAQACMNVISGGRYKVIPKEIRAYVKGQYGNPPGPVSEELRAKVLLKGEQPIICRPADLLAPGFAKAQQESAAFAKTEEDVLTYALFPQVGKEFLEKKYGLK